MSYFYIKLIRLKNSFIPLILTIATACSSGAKNDTSSNPEKNVSVNMTPDSISESKEIQKEYFDMSNPAFMMGTNIGSLFNTYYKVGDFDKMLSFTDSASIRKYGRENLKKYYRKADLGMEMKLKNMTSEGNEKILHYELVVNATKIIKRLHAVIEKDTARVVPQDPESGRIFE
jgi:hypothetical protein